MKIYKSDIRAAIHYIKVGGVETKIKFQDKGEPYCYGVFASSDKEICNAIESLPCFGKTISLLECDEESEPEEEKVYNKVYPSITRTQDANKILVCEYGIDKATLNSKADALGAAEKLNISFPNL